MLTQPLFLIGLAAIAIPIAIHLLQLRRYRKVYFSNVDMLQELENENRRQRNLRQLLILAARILAILFIVLAFCQPVIPHKDSRLQSGGTVVSVYVDNSYSMECGGMEGSLIETAKQKAREIAAAYDPSISFQLLTNNASGSQFRWLSREELLQAVDLVEAGAVTTPLSVTAAHQNQFLLSATAGNRHAYLISDFQRSTSDLSQLPADSAVLSTLIPLGLPTARRTLPSSPPSFPLGAVHWPMSILTAFCSTARPISLEPRSKWKCTYTMEATNPSRSSLCASM